jgi:23S rRNA pseudouridine2604 synthase
MNELEYKRADVVGMSDPVRLNKFIADSGLCSRREADRLIEAGKVTVDGETAEQGMKIEADEKVVVDGREIKREPETIVLVFNKPPGITCTTAEDDDSNVVKYIHYSKRIYPIGRLDKFSEGLLLLTNRGDLVNGIMRARYMHEKEYIATIDRPVTDDLLERLRRGVFLPELEVTTRPCKATKVARNRFSIVITQGLNRQVRRMCEAVGCRVTRLVRVRIMDIELGDLPSGEWRKATRKEIDSIMSKKAQ